jgi:serine/threonine-protein phosphatase 2A regulatory subunit B
MHICIVFVAVVDTKPANMDDLSEVITAAKCHPSQCYTIAYATSKGVVKLLDTRKSTLCDDPVAVLQGHDASSIGAFSQYDLFGASNNSFFSEMLEAISDFT